jgi:AhpD family alkylhydroperoxidase
LPGIKFAPKEASAFFNLKHTAERKDGVIPGKYRELMSVAVALTTQCAYCIDAHVKNAVQAGATREEIAETVFIAAALRAGVRLGTACSRCASSRKQLQRLAGIDDARHRPAASKAPTCPLGHGRCQAVVLELATPGWSSTPRGMAIEPTMKPL